MTKKRWITDLEDPRTTLILYSAILACLAVIAPGEIREGGAYGVFVAIVLVTVVGQVIWSARRVLRLPRSWSDGTA